MNISSFFGMNENIKERQLSVHSWLIILIGVLLIGGLCFFVKYQINYEYDSRIVEVSNETMNLAIAFEEQVRRIIVDADKDLLSLKRAYEREGIFSPVVADYLAGRGDYAGRNQVAIYDEQGFIVGSFTKGLSLRMNYSDRSYFQVQRDFTADTLFIGPTIQLRASGQNTIPLSRRINKPDGSFGGIAYIGLKVDYFLEFYQKMNLGQDQSITLTGMDGFLRARQTNDKVNFGEDIRHGTLWKDNIQTGRPYGTFTTNAASDGVNRISSYRVLPEYSLIVAVGKSTQIAMAPFEQRKKGYILGASLVSLLILLFCGLLVNRNERQLTFKIQLAILVGEKTQELQAQYAVVQKREDELFRVNCELVETNVAVQTERDRLATLINSMNDEVWFVDTKKKISMINSHLFRETRIYSDEIDVEEIAANLEVFRPDGNPRPAEETPLLRGLLGESITNEQEIIRSPVSGKWRHREFSVNPVRDGGGNIIGAIADITERKAMEDEIRKHRDNLQALVKEQIVKIKKINAEMTAIVESISDPFYVLNKEWRWIGRMLL